MHWYVARYKFFAVLSYWSILGVNHFYLPQGDLTMDNCDLGVLEQTMTDAEQ
jgi:hypothetical protein